MKSFTAEKITEKVYWVGAIDWGVRDFHGYLTSRGSTYNAFLIIDEKVTLIEAEPVTGRTHQIRVHMSYIHFPLVGDPVYGGRLALPAGASSELRDTLRAFRRQALCATHLEFDQPDTGERTVVSMQPTDDFMALVRTLDADLKARRDD